MALQKHFPLAPMFLVHNSTGLDRKGLALLFLALLFLVLLDLRDDKLRTHLVSCPYPHRAGSQQQFKLDKTLPPQFIIKYSRTT